VMQPYRDRSTARQLASLNEAKKYIGSERGKHSEDSQRRDMRTDIRDSRFRSGHPSIRIGRFGTVLQTHGFVARTIDARPRNAHCLAHHANPIPLAV
jgi:hypothetical protein